MSRGAGRMMRAALAELEDAGHTEAFAVAIRAAHDAACGCDDRLCLDKTPRPARSQLVSARRALHTLARGRDIELYRISSWERPPALAARRVSVVKAANSLPRQHIPVREAAAQMSEFGGRQALIPAESESLPCASCLRPSGHGGGRPGRQVLCDECAAGVTDAIGVVSSGDYAVGWGPIRSCDECGGQLSVYGYRRIHVDDARQALCDSCHDRHQIESCARHGVDLPALWAQLALKPA